MDRRTFLKSGVAATAGIGAASAVTAEAAAAPPSSSIALKTALSPHFARGYLRDRADRFAQRLKDMTGGRLTLDLIAAPPGSGIMNVRNGGAAAYFGTEADHIGDHRGLSYFGGLPGGLSLAPEHFATWLSAGGGQLYWDDIAADFGVKSFAVGHSGRRAGLWAARDIENSGKLAGRHGYMIGVAAHAAERLGVTTGFAADTTPDLAEPLMGPTAWLADNPKEQNRIWFSDGFHRDGVVLSFGLSLDVWQHISVQDQAILTACANEAYYQSLAEHDAHDTAIAPHLFKARGVEQRRLPDDISKAISHVTAVLLSEWQAGDVVSARIHASHMQFLQNITGTGDAAMPAAAVS